MKAFIISTKNNTINLIKKLLNDLNIESQDIYDIPSDYSFIEDEVNEKIKNADFVIAIIEELDANVFYEIGLSKGLGKPVFFIVNKNVKLPVSMTNMTHITSSLNDKNLIKKSLSKFIDEINFQGDNNIKKLKKFNLESKLRIKNFSTIKQQIEKIRNEGTEKDLENITQKLFNMLNKKIVFNSIKQNKGVDYAIWVDELQYTIGNPIFIELKYGKLSENYIYNAEKQLVKNLEKTDTQAAILLYLDKNGNKYENKFHISPLVLRFDYEDFINGLEEKGFIELILNRRNAIAHNEYGGKK